MFLHFFSRTPGSRQPSPADETLTRPQTLLDPNAFHQQHFQHMMNTNMDQHHHAAAAAAAAAGQQYHPQIMNQMQAPVMNGVNSLQVQQVREFDFSFV